MSSAGLKQIVDPLGPDAGFSHWGWAPLERPLSFDLYREWIGRGHHGEMNYLAEHLPLKENPSTRFPFARGALAFAFPYANPHPEQGHLPLRAARIARYARGEDYHHWLKDRLRTVADRLRLHYPSEEFEVHCDSSPLIERDLAVRAGLGWIGRNGCVIHPRHGSFFLLGEILSSLDQPLPSAVEVRDFCGTCNACVEACPTQALNEKRQMDARRCLSYLSIESRRTPDLEFRPAWGDWMFGCDLCQSVCPWNQKPLGLSFGQPSRERQNFPEIAADERRLLVDELRWVLSASGQQIQKVFRATALNRAGPFGLKRNAMMVAASRRLRELGPEIHALQGHPRLGELATWAFREVTCG